MSHSAASEDLVLSTSQANDAAPSFSRTGGARVAHPAPHLVGTPKQHVRPGTSEERADHPGTAHGFSSSEHSESRSESHWTQEVEAERPYTSALHAALKRAIDIFGALLIAIALSPPLVTACIALWLQGGPVIYKHRRIGRGGKTFECLKFRTMQPNADQALRDLLEQNPELKLEWVRDHKLRNDPRVTPIGRFLRHTSLDELPQLWNVLRGEMSLVGPRPIVREELLRYGRKVQDYLAIKPGITGLWQVMGRNDTNYRRRVVLDTYYARNQNLLLDVYILVKTTGVVLGRTGAY
jgi:exopolysaccharide production protein ExoY